MFRLHEQRVAALTVILSGSRILFSFTRQINIHRRTYLDKDLLRLFGDLLEAEFAVDDLDRRGMAALKCSTKSAARHLHFDWELKLWT